ncbi:MAG: hypothetical protein H6567_00920 [Lewinellaceae bacterium]|nr:hypothetical protein [Lewinellaceae bacterium]
MKYYFYLLITLQLTACTIPTPMRVIQDQVKNEEIHIFNSTKITRSKVNRNLRSFKLSFIHYKSDPESIKLEVISNFTSIEPDYKDTVYLVFPQNSTPLALGNISENINYKEKENTITELSTTTTDVKVDNTTKIEPNKSINEASKDNTQVVTDTKTTTTTQTDKNTSIDTEILDKVASKRYVQIPISELAKNPPFQKFSLRIYTNNSYDFWDLTFTETEIDNIRNMMKLKPSTNR